MKSKNIKLVTLVFFSTALTLAFQNCGQIQPGLSVSETNQKGTRAVIIDSEGQIDATITLDNQADMQDTGDSPAVVPALPQESPVIVASEAEQDDAAPVPQDADCSELAKKYKNEAIDLAKIQSSSKLVLLKGKTFIFSSGANDSLSEVEVGKSCGRLILCGVRIDKINVIKGRLDLIRSTVLETVQHNGVTVTQ